MQALTQMRKKAADAVLNTGHLLFPRASVKPEGVAERSTFEKGRLSAAWWAKGPQKAERLPLGSSRRAAHARGSFYIAQVNTDSNLDPAHSQWNSGRSGTLTDRQLYHRPWASFSLGVFFSFQSFSIFPCYSWGDKLKWNDLFIVTEWWAEHCLLPKPTLFAKHHVKWVFSPTVL